MKMLSWWDRFVVLNHVTEKLGYRTCLHTSPNPDPLEEGEGESPIQGLPHTLPPSHIFCPWLCLQLPRQKEQGLGQRYQRMGMEVGLSLLGQMGPLCPLPSPGNLSLAFCPSWNS